MPTLLGQFIDAGQVYRWYAALLLLLMLLGVGLFSRLVLPARAHLNGAEQSGSSLTSALRALPGESLRLFGVYGLSMLASSIPAVLVIFYVRDLIGAEHLTGAFLLLYFLSGAAAMPLWKKASSALGKYKTWCLANILAVAGFIYAFFLTAGDIWAYAAVCLVSGIALGADLILPPSILADQIHARGNAARSATHYAGLAFIGKASLALASFIALPILDAAGFQPNTHNSAAALAILSISYALIPCALKLGAAALLYIFFIRFHSGGNDEHIQDHGNNGSSHHA